MRIVHALLFTAACLLTVGGASARPLGMGTMSPGTLSYSSGAAIGRVLHERLGLELRVQPHGGETVLMPLLDDGELDFAIASVVEAADAYVGRGVFEGRPQRRLRIAAVLFPLRVALFVRADSDIHRISDLAGRRVPAGFIAMASIERMLAAILANGGLALDDIKAVPVPNVVTGAERFLDGRADAFFFAVGAAKVREVDASVPLRMLVLAQDTPALDAMRAVFADGYPSPVPTGLTPGGTGDAGAVALAFDNLLLSAEQVPAATVRAVVGALAAQRRELAAGFAPFRELRVKTLRKSGLPLPFHEGALSWKEAGQ